MSKRIFIVDDEADLIRIATDVLEMDGFSVSSATHPADALRKINANPPDIIILDLRLPDMDGYEVAKLLKADVRTKHVPIIMVSAKCEETDVVVGLEVGADDYITKPFRQKELLARVKTVLRRFHTEPGPRNLVTGPLSLNCGNYTAALHTKPVPLTLREFQLLSYFVEMEGRVLTRNKIYETVWGVDFSGSSRTIDVHVDQLRKKLGKYADSITTLKGIGYKFELVE